MVSPVNGGLYDIRLMLEQTSQARLFASLVGRSPASLSGTLDLTTSFISQEAQRAYAELLDALQGATAAAPSDANLSVAAGDYWLARAEGATSDTERLRAYYNALAEYGEAEGSAAGQLGLGETYAALGMADESLAAYERAVEIDPRSTAARIALGGAYAGSDDDATAAKAEAQFREAIRLAPTEADAYLGLAAYHESRKDVARARETLESGLAYLPGNKALAAALAALDENAKP